MGDFASSADVTKYALVDSLISMDMDTLEFMFIVPAERIIEEAFCLSLNTDRIPYHWESQFELYSWKEDNFKADYKRAVILLVNRMATNPHEYASESVRGAAVSHRLGMPAGVAALMRRWGTDRELYRT